MGKDRSHGRGPNDESNLARKEGLVIVIALLTTFGAGLGLVWFIFWCLNKLGIL